MARQWIEVEIEEPFPVFYSHVDCPSERKRETARGPFYAAHSTSYHAPSDKSRAWAEWSAAALREAGWTVNVRDVVR